MTRSHPQHQTIQVVRLQIVERILCNGGGTVNDIRQAIETAGFGTGGESGEMLSDKTVRRLIGALDQLGVQVNRSDSPGGQSRFTAVRSTAVFRNSLSVG